MPPAPTVLAAGGVVLRDGEHGREVLVVHRPSHDDWSLPKGKLDPGEDLLTTALREVHEETGVHARLGAHLGTTDYRDRFGRQKRVHWWSMTPSAVEAREPDDEVDAVAWMPVDAPGLDYDADRAILATALDDRRSLLVVRHAHAGTRGSVEPDRARGLSDRGRRQVDGLITTLGGHRIDSIVTSPFTRCRETMEPLASSRGLEVVADDRLAEETPTAAVLELVASLPTATVVCSHGDVVGNLVEHLASTADTPTDEGFDELRWKKASTWWITLADSRAVAARYLPPRST